MLSLSASKGRKTLGIFRPLIHLSHPSHPRPLRDVAEWLVQRVEVVEIAFKDRVALVKGIEPHRRSAKGSGLSESHHH